MRKIIYVVISLLATFSATAESYFTIDGVVNDTLLINPLFLGNAVNITFRAHFDGRLDYWHLTITYPPGLSYGEQNMRGSDMNVPFVNRWGQDSIWPADLALLQSGSIFTSSIVKKGYWDPDGDGNYDTYGTVKWEAGDYPEMFKILLGIDSSFRSDTLSIESLMSSTHDWRGGTIGSGVYSYKDIVVHVGYKRGDVNGDGMLNAADVTLLINFVLNQSGWNEFQFEAGDMTGDGNLTTTDVTALINMVLQNGGTLDFDPVLDI